MNIKKIIHRNILRNQKQSQKSTAALQRRDRITVVLCGVGSPMARQGAQICTAVFVNGQFLLFDAGDNAMASMRSSNLPLDRLDAVFITHFHNDHYADLGEVMEWSWILGRRQILPIHGPTGMAQIVDGFMSAYELEKSYRTAHHGPEMMPPEWASSRAVEFAPTDDDSAILVYEKDGVAVKSFRGNHAPIEPAVGYRIEFGGKGIVISGDTIRTKALLVHSRQADLLVADAMNKGIVQWIEVANREIGNTFNAAIMADIQDYHMDVSDVGRLAQEAHVKRLALNHLAPMPRTRRQANRFFRDPVAKHYSGDIVVGRDGMRIIISVS